VPAQRRVRQLLGVSLPRGGTACALQAGERCPVRRGTLRRRSRCDGHQSNLVYPQAMNAVAVPPNCAGGPARRDAVPTEPEVVARWLRDSARWLRRHPWKHPRRNRQRRRLRYANPIHAASKSDTPRVSGDQSGAREGQSTAGADTKERLNTCNRRLLTRALPTYAIPHRPSAALALSVPPAIRGHHPRQNATRSRRTAAEARLPAGVQNLILLSASATPRAHKI
jgi:hypothetical protein